jgi:hypothetical protein
VGKRAAIALLVACAHARASAAPCADDAAARAAAIRAHLDHEVHRGRVWDVGWGAGFAVVTVGYAAAADARWNFGLAVDDHAVDGLWVASAKAGVASLSHLVLPLRVERAPAPTADPCADLAAAERALATTASHERTAFWLGIAGGVALNGAAFLWLGLRDHAWKEAWVSVGIGLPVAAIHTWTTPSASRTAAPPETWQLDVAIAPGASGLVLTGSW